MHHKILEIKAVATDRGEFVAIAAAYSVDRYNEQIARGAFEKTIAAWRARGKNIPLHWDHGGDPSSIIGTVDPGTMAEVEEGLQVTGKLDIESSEKAREAWRAMKGGSMGLSFGYLSESTEREDGVTELTEIDLFEVSITPAPVNPDTRFLSLKSTTTSPEVEDGEVEEPEEAKTTPQDALKSQIDRLLIDIKIDH